MKQRRRKVWLAVLILWQSMSAHATEKDETLTLTDSKKIAYAMALNEAIDQVSKKVAACVEKKLVAPEKCFCLYPTEVNRVREKYEVALKNSPEWKDKIVSWTMKGNPLSYTLSFDGLRRQLEKKCE